jgi:sec-independent protein translocase protein TatB
VFGSLGWWEIALLIVVALLVFGPDKLPSIARDAAGMLRQLRSLARGARTQLKSELGPEFADFDFDSLNPKTFVRKHLLDDSEDDIDDDAGVPPRAAERRKAQEPLRDGERAPYDPDAT